MPKISELRFLVVDDMLTMRKIVSQQLKALGATMIQEASDGSVAWDLLRREGASPIDFVVSDWNMPEMKGIELLRKCRESAAHKGVAFLLVTAEAEASQVKEALTAGVDSYVVKPFSPAAFEEKIKAVIAKRFPTS